VDAPRAPADRVRTLLESLGISSAEELYRDIPPELRCAAPLRLGPSLAEADLSARLLELAAPDTHLDESVCFLGAGTYDHYVPAVVDAAAAAVGPRLVGPDAPEPLLQLVLELEMLFAALTALDVAAAPIADGPSALVAAIRLAAAATGRREVAVARSVHPLYRAIAQTMLAGPALAFREVGDPTGIVSLDAVERQVTDATACLVVEHPNFFGCLEDVAPLAAAAHRHGALLVVKVDPLSLGLLAPPGDTGADVAVADAQALGSRPAWGAASLGLLACRRELADKLPCWRVEPRGDAGLSVHCGTAALGCERTGGDACATSVPIRADRLARPVAYLAALGAEGLARAAALSASRAHALQQRICSVEGFDRRFRAPFFKEFVVESAQAPDEIIAALLDSNILGPLSLELLYPEMEHCLLFSATERRTKADMDLLLHALDLAASDDLDEEREDEDGDEDE
jgi:glycine dehydrogenase subunit 1